MDADAFRTAAHAAIEEIIEYRQGLSNRRALSDVQPGYLAPQLPQSAPETGVPWSKIQPDIERFITPGLTHWDSPHFMAFFPATISYASIIGEMYSAAFTAPAFNWICSPASTELETVVTDWICKMLGLPECYLSKGEGGGVIQGSASEAVVVAMVAARDRALDRLTADLEGEEKEDRMDELRPKMVALGSEQAHSATAKGAKIAGTKSRTVHAGAETDFAMDGKALREKLEECTKKGWIPYYLTATLGTTNTCAVDRFEDIAEVMQDYPNLWVHIDAAYAGSALVCPEYQHLTNVFDKFDSVNFNMHKWLLVNFDASILFFKSRAPVVSALSITPSYLRNSYTDSGLVTDYRDWQIPLGRRFRALKIWFVLRTYGVEGLQAHVRKTIRLGEFFADLARSRSDLFDIISGPSYGLTVFTVKPAMKGRASVTNGATNVATEESLPAPLTSDIPPNDTSDIVTNGNGSHASPEDVETANALTKNVYERVNARGPVYLTGTVVGGRYAIRVVSANEQAEEKYVREAFEVIVEEAEGALKDANAT